MVLAYLDVPVPFEGLLAALNIGPYGAPRRNIVALSRFGVSVAYREGTLEFLNESLEAALPVIAFVHTGELGYWAGRLPSDHAVVVVGLEGDRVLLNDPEFEHAPQAASLDEFELAWQASDYACAVISLP